MKPGNDKSLDHPTRAVRDYLFLSAAMLLLTTAALVLVPVAVMTGFRARRFYSETIVRRVSRLILRLAGVRVKAHCLAPPPRGPVFYMTNHPSVLDVFTLTALGLPNTRFFLSRGVRVYPPLALIAWLIGVFFTPPQGETEQRIRCFQRAGERLRRSGESVLGSPEGRVTPLDRVGRFNRGVFHLATDIGIPIVPIYIAFPPGRNPGRRFVPRPCVVDVHFLPEIPTVGWKLDELDQNKEDVRAVFISFGDRLAGDTSLVSFPVEITRAGARRPFNLDSCL